MKAIILCLGLILLSGPASTAQDLDLKRIAPPSAHLAIHAKANPERDYQQQLMQQVWDKVESEELVERFLKIITSRMSEENLSQANSLLDEFKQAIAPARELSSQDFEESYVAQVYQFPTNHTVVALKLKGDAAAKCETTFKNFAALVERLSQGKVPVATLQQGEFTITSIALPEQVMMQPCCVRIDSAVLFSTSQTLMTQALANLQADDFVSKFDDPRLAEALQHLPEPEDSLVFFDAKQLFEGIRSMEAFIANQPNAEENPEQLSRVMDVMNLVLDELAAVDYTATVQTTDGYATRTASLEKYAADAHERLIGMLVLSGKPFTDWQRWIPADAQAYDLDTGLQLHAAYEHVIEILKTHFPETQEALEKFAQVQEKIDLRLDKDIFQSFSGESLSVTLPGKEGSQETVCALRCTNPERIKELLHRLVGNVASIPALETQQIALKETEGLPGFETLNASILAAFNVKPVIGFHEEWMMMGSSKDAIERVLAAYAGEAPTITSSEQFGKFDLPVEDTLIALTYTDLHAGIHNAADVIRKIGGVAPMFVAMAAKEAKADQLQVVSELLALLPSVADVVEEFDFYDSSLTTVTEGPLPNSHLKQSVTLIEPSATEEQSTVAE